MSEHTKWQEKYLRYKEITQRIHTQREYTGADVEEYQTIVMEIYNELTRKAQEHAEMLELLREVLQLKEMGLSISGSLSRAKALIDRIDKG